MSDLDLRAQRVRDALAARGTGDVRLRDALADGSLTLELVEALEARVERHRALDAKRALETPAERAARLARHAESEATGAARAEDVRLDEAHDCDRYCIEAGCALWLRARRAELGPGPGIGPVS